MLSAADGQPVGFMMVVRDISEQSRLEGELRESEERFRGLVEGMTAAVFILRSGRIVYANPAAAALCGCTARELEGSAWRERVASRDLLVAEEALARIERREAGREEWACALIGENGRQLDTRVVVSPAEFDGRPAALLLVQDESRAQRAAVEVAAQRGEAGCGDRGRVRRHPGPRRRRGRGGRGPDGEPRDGRSPRPVGGGDPRRERLPGVGAVRGGGEGMADLADRLAGRERISSRTSRSPSPGGARERCGCSHLRCAAATESPLGRLIVCRDLTDQRASERRLKLQAEELRAGRVELEDAYRRLSETNARLQEGTEELDRVNVELRRLDEMKSSLLGNVSHELQTPLVSIRGYTEMMLKERLGPITDEQRKGLSLSLRSIDRLIGMIDNLLAFTRNDPEHVRLDLSHFPLRSLIDEAVDMMRGEMESRQIELTVEMEDEETRIQGDRNRLLEVFLNLLSNAVKFNRPQGTIHVRAKAGQSGYAAVTVRDNGIGIPEESIGRIFDRHFRVESDGTERTEGSGIGLSIVRDILRLHGCTIHVDSEEGRGTGFTFTLPLTLSLDGSETVDDSPEPPPPAPNAAPPSELRTQPPAPSVPRRVPGPEREGDVPPRLRIIRRAKPEG